MSESITDLHHEAMEFADKAFVYKREGNFEHADACFQLAMEKEAQAARMLKESLDQEPSRSVLYRSAAALAVECGELKRAKELIDTAFMGNPPLAIADELGELRERIKREEDLLPTLDDLFGIVPSVPGELSSEEIVRNIRDRWDDK